MSETTFDGTLISKTSFETLRSEDSLAKRVSAFGADKPTFLIPNGAAERQSAKMLAGHRLGFAIEVTLAEAFSRPLNGRALLMCRKL